MDIDGFALHGGTGKAVNATRQETATGNCEQ
jgi:hypothetical protein